MRMTCYKIASYANSEFIVDSGMQIDRSPVQIKGKILAPPSVVYGKENVVRRVFLVEIWLLMLL